MLRFRLLPYIGKVAVDLENPSIADRFAEVMVRAHCEYELPPDVLAAAEDVLRALTARGKTRIGRSQSHLATEVSGVFRSPCTKSTRTLLN
jgi:hypothetical protein